jgi:hypothetical protein
VELRPALLGAAAGASALSDTQGGGGVPPQALMEAVQEMLGAMGMPLDLERSKLLQGNLEKQKQLTDLQVK